MKNRFKFIPLTPFTIPVLLFVPVIFTGALLLHIDLLKSGQNVGFIDSLFTAVSATCVTGLSVLDTGTDFSLFGQIVILVLIQLGGLGIVTYTCFIFYLAGKKIPLKERISVTSNLMFNPSLNFRKFLLKVVIFTLAIESTGAALLKALRPKDFSFFSAVFHSVSAFCNAGFSLFPDSLTRFQNDITMNFVFIALIILGGLGFSVLIELYIYFYHLIFKRRKKRLSWYTKLVLKTTCFLIISGFAVIFYSEYFSSSSTLFKNIIPHITTALFQSVTCRTAGFNTIDLGLMTNTSLLFMIFLMYVGGASGSCAGGIKVGSLRVLSAFIVANIKGRRQVVIDKYAIDFETLNKAIILVVSSFLFIMISVFILNITECSNLGLNQARNTGFDIFFEIVSAFGTAGLSTGLTSQLTTTGKIIISFLMFIGRIGPVGIIAAIQSYQKKSLINRPEESLLVG